MHLSEDISKSLQMLEAVQKAINESDDDKLQMNTAEDMKLILDLLQDPVFRNIIQVQDSLAELNVQIGQHPSILPSDFGVNEFGQLIINTVPPTSSDFYGDHHSDYTDEQRVPSAQLSPSSHHGQQPNSLSGPIGSVSDQILAVERQSPHLHHHHHHNTSGGSKRDMEDITPSASGAESATNSLKHSSNDLLASSEWAQVQSIQLVNDGTGLGFGIIGARTAGVIVKTILPGGVADRDQRLLSGDHILQIGDVNLHEMGSEQVASVLRQSGTHVRLVVARPVDPMNVSQDTEGSAIVPARLLSDPPELDRYLIAAGYPDIFGVSSTPSTPLSGPTGAHFTYPNELHGQEIIDLPETERFIVELTKDNNGLGITIAG